MDQGDVNRQYQDMGEDYISNQRQFFTDNEDWTRLKIRKELRESHGKLLDIGCGAGDDIAWCEENGIEAYGVDSSEKMINLAKQTIKNTDRVQIGEHENIPFSDNYFDIVMGRYSLHYLNDFSKAYEEIARVMNKGGKLLLIVSHPTFDAISQDENKIVFVKLYESRVTVKFPAHRFDDYFSKRFLELFDLEEVDESDSVDAENPNKVSETLYFKAIKR